MNFEFEIEKLKTFNEVKIWSFDNQVYTLRNEHSHLFRPDEPGYYTPGVSKPVLSYKEKYTTLSGKMVTDIDTVREGLICVKTGKIIPDAIMRRRERWFSSTPKVPPNISMAVFSVLAGYVNDCIMHSEKEEFDHLLDHAVEFENKEKVISLIYGCSKEIIIDIDSFMRGKEWNLQELKHNQCDLCLRVAGDYRALSWMQAQQDPPEVTSALKRIRESLLVDHYNSEQEK